MRRLLPVCPRPAAATPPSLCGPPADAKPRSHQAIARALSSRRGPPSLPRADVLELELIKKTRTPTRARARSTVGSASRHRSPCRVRPARRPRSLRGAGAVGVTLTRGEGPVAQPRARVHEPAAACRPRIPFHLPRDQCTSTRVM